MTSNVETVNVKFDIIKLVIAVLVAISTIAGFYIFSDKSSLLRFGGLLAGMVAAIGIALQTEKGRSIWTFFQDSQIEVRRVVWPTREETLQTTLIVILVVIIVGFILWLLDMFLGSAVQYLMGLGG